MECQFGETVAPGRSRALRREGFLEERKGYAAQKRPPNHVRHVREWNYPKFEAYIRRWFRIEDYSYSTAPITQPIVATL